MDNTDEGGFFLSFSAATSGLESFSLFSSTPLDCPASAAHGHAHDSDRIVFSCVGRLDFELLL
jgi:hypothetical protein